MTTRDIRAHLREMYDVEVSPDLISRVTDGVLEELAEWQARPPGRVYPVILTGRLMVKIRDRVAVPAPARRCEPGRRSGQTQVGVRLLGPSPCQAHPWGLSSGEPVLPRRTGPRSATRTTPDLEMLGSERTCGRCRREQT